MTTFEIIASQPPPSGPELATCQCPPVGNQRNVLLSLDAGGISVHCPACQLPIGVDPEELLANDLPMVMTTVVEKVPADSFSGFEIGAIYHELTPASEAADVHAFADIVDHIRNIGRKGKTGGVL